MSIDLEISFFSDTVHEGRFVFITCFLLLFLCRHRQQSHPNIIVLEVQINRYLLLRNVKHRLLYLFLEHLKFRLAQVKQTPVEVLFWNFTCFIGDLLYGKGIVFVK